MKPAKSAVPAANWFLRASLCLYWVFPFLQHLSDIHLKTKEDIVGLILVGGSTLLFIGGFVSKPLLTIFSGGAIALASLYMIFVNLDWPLTQPYLLWLWPLGIGLHFLGRGNG